jgi:hypothetical protein
MSKRSIQFAGVLFMLAAILAVSAQETATVLDNATMNNTTLLNNTTLNATTSEPVIVAANETVIEAPILPAETANETAQNETASVGNESAPVANEPIPAPIETAPAPIEAIAAQNETAPAQNTTTTTTITTPPSENTTAIAEPVINASPALQPGAMQIGSPQRAAYAIGGIAKSPNTFSIDGKALAQGAYEVGLPAKTIMDLSALPFFINKI